MKTPIVIAALFVGVFTASASALGPIYLDSGSASISLVLDVSKLGADRTGATDSTTVIEDVINLAESGTAGTTTVYFPPGTYSFNLPTALLVHDIDIVGARKEAREDLGGPSNTAGDTVFKPYDPTKPVFANHWLNCNLSNFMGVGAGAYNVGSVGWVFDGGECTLNSVEFVDFETNFDYSNGWKCHFIQCGFFCGRWNFLCETKGSGSIITGASGDQTILEEPEWGGDMLTGSGIRQSGTSHTNIGGYITGGGKCFTIIEPGMGTEGVAMFIQGSNVNIIGGDIEGSDIAGIVVQGPANVSLNNVHMDIGNPVPIYAFGSSTGGAFTTLSITGNFNFRVFQDSSTGSSSPLILGVTTPIPVVAVTNTNSLFSQAYSGSMIGSSTLPATVLANLVSTGTITSQQYIPGDHVIGSVVTNGIPDLPYTLNLASSYINPGGGWGGNGIDGTWIETNWNTSGTQAPPFIILQSGMSNTYDWTYPREMHFHGGGSNLAAGLFGVSSSGTIRDYFMWGGGISGTTPSTAFTDNGFGVVLTGAATQFTTGLSPAQIIAVSGTTVMLSGTILVNNNYLSDIDVRFTGNSVVATFTGANNHISGTLNCGTLQPEVDYSSKISSWFTVSGSISFNALNYFQTVKYDVTP